MKLKDGTLPPSEPPSNVVPIRAAPKTGRLTMASYFPAAKAFVAATGTMVALNAREPEDREAMEVWRAYLASIGGLGHGPHLWLSHAMETALSRRDATVWMPARLPSEMTGIAADDRHGCTDA